MLRMVELGGRLGFVAEAGDLPLIEHGRKRQNLQRHAAVERFLMRLVNDAHAAAADLADDAVVADLPCRRRLLVDCSVLYRRRLSIYAQVARRTVQQVAGYRDTAAARRPDPDAQPAALPDRAHCPAPSCAR